MQTELHLMARSMACLRTRIRNGDCYEFFARFNHLKLLSEFDNAVDRVDQDIE